jgi:hypothetical protein
MGGSGLIVPSKDRYQRLRWTADIGRSATVAPRDRDLPNEITAPFALPPPSRVVDRGAIPERVVRIAGAM